METGTQATRAATTNEGRDRYPLGLQLPPDKVVRVGFGGLTTF